MRIAGPPLTRRVMALPWAAILVGAALFVLLAAFVSADPAGNVTFSSSPFSDEGFNLVNARNLVQLGRWDTDQWNLYLVNLPYSLLAAASFRILGVGIDSARLVSIVCVSATAGALACGLRRSLGTAWAAFGGVAFATSGLVLFYGRLAYVEDLVVLGLALGNAGSGVARAPEPSLGPRRGSLLRRRDRDQAKRHLLDRRGLDRARGRLGLAERRRPALAGRGCRLDRPVRARLDPAHLAAQPRRRGASTFASGRRSS